MTEVNVSTSMEEMTATVEEMTATVEEMSMTVEEMSATVEKLKKYVLENLRVEIFIHNSALITSEDTWNNT